MKTERMMDGDEQALRDAVVEAALEWNVSGKDEWQGMSDLRHCVEALRTHRAKPVPAPRSIRDQVHDLITEYQGRVRETDDGDLWNLIHGISDIRAKVEGDSVAKPETTALVEPTDEAITEFLDQWLSSAAMRAPYYAIIRAALRTFKPQVQKVDDRRMVSLSDMAEIARRHGEVASVSVTDLMAFTDEILVKFNPVAVQKVEASDEAIQRFRDEWGERNGHDFKRTDYLKVALAKFTPYNPEPLGRYEYLDIALRCGMKRCTSPGKPAWFELTVPAMEFIREFARAIEAKVRGAA